MGNIEFTYFSRQDIILSLMLCANKLSTSFPHDNWGEFDKVDNEIVEIIIEKLNKIIFDDIATGKTHRFIYTEKPFDNDLANFLTINYPDGTIAPINQKEAIEIEEEKDTPYKRYKDSQPKSKFSNVFSSSSNDFMASRIDIYTVRLKEGVTLNSKIDESYFSISLLSLLRQKVNPVFLRAIQGKIMAPDQFFAIQDIKQKRYNVKKADKEALKEFYSSYEISFLQKANEYPNFLRKYQNKIKM